MLAALARTVWVLVILVGVSLTFAWILQRMGRDTRLGGVTYWSKAYWYFVSPGVACHELGHCMGCWITGNHVSKVVFFTADNDEYLGCVWHSCPGGLWGSIQQTIISAGPIWFGCLMIALLSKLLLGSAVAVRLDDYVECVMAPGIIEYVVACFRAGVRLVAGVALDIARSPFRAILWIYLSYCIASEIGMSGIDLSHAWKGLAVVIVGIVLLSLIPWIGQWVMAGVCFALPAVFVAHALMAMGVMVSIAMRMLQRMIRWQRNRGTRC